MALCGFCNKWMEKGTGKREKKFCNNTCRSNFWYAKNKKGKQTDSEPKIKFTPTTPAAYDGSKSNKLEQDEQAMLPEPKLPLPIPKTAAQWMKEKRNIENEDDYQEWLMALEADPYLGKKQKDLIRSTNPSEL